MSKALNPLTMDQQARIKNEQHQIKHIDNLHRCRPELAPGRRHQLNRRLNAFSTAAIDDTDATQHRKSPLAATAGSSTHLTYWLKTSTRAKRSLRVIHGADKTGKAHLDALAEPEEQKSTTTQQHKKQQIKRYATPKHPDRVQIDSSQLLSENLNRKTIQRQSRARARRWGAEAPEKQTKQENDGRDDALRAGTCAHTTAGYRSNHFTQSNLRELGGEKLYFFFVIDNFGYSITTWFLRGNWVR
ncbi:unnamed protein product [Brassica rapa subsp. narinosa]